MTFNRKGFTLMEMMVVIGIIAILSGVLFGAFSTMRKAADKARLQDLVSSAATALASILEKEQGWPRQLLSAAAQSDAMLDETACQALIARGVFSLSYKNATTGTDKYKLVGTDRCGIVDPWAHAALRALDPSRSADSARATHVSSGGTVKEHTLRFAIDDNYDGITEAKVNGVSVSVRAPAVVWGCGADGVFADYSLVGHSDDAYSWQKGQVQ